MPSRPPSPVSPLSPPLDLELGLIDTIPLMRLSNSEDAATQPSRLNPGPQYHLETRLDDRADSDAQSQQQQRIGRPDRNLGIVFSRPGLSDRITAHARSADLRLTQRLRRSRFHGWRMGVLIGCCMSTLVLGCNIAMIVIGAVSGFDNDGVADLITGDETKITRWNTALHILINTLSTVLLAGSNYTMQVLSSPTRGDIDKAHARNQWLEVGILSPRNMRSLPRRRRYLCLLLSLSSIPLHLFYNASVYKITASNEWNLNIVDVNRLVIDGRINKYSNLTPAMGWTLADKEWREPYSKQYTPDRGDLYLFIDRMAFPTVQQYYQTPNPGPQQIEMPGNQTIVASLTSETTEWILLPGYDGSANSTPISAHVAYAYSFSSKNRSRVQISLHFMTVVVVFNMLKLMVMTTVLVTDRSAYLVTLGDAAASFLKRPDPNTDGKCILGKEELFTSLGLPALHPTSKDEEAKALGMRSKGIWSPRPRRYLFSINRHGKVIYSMLVLLIITLLACLPLYMRDYMSQTDLDLGISSSASTTSWAWGSASDDSISFGSGDTTSAGTLYNAWLANMPQLFLSFAFLNINTICTSMAFEQEWNGLATSRKYLRVTKPVGLQRSTYFLQLPYRWSLPLITIGGVLHWLLSQAFFLVRIDFYNRKGEKTQDSKSACGFSVLCLTIFMAFALLLLIVVGVIGFWKRPMSIPVAGSCSLAISAACHPPSDEIDAQLKMVQWGVVDLKEGEGHGHCSLSSGSVELPKIGKTYF
ncbi:hypothetical protein CC86DRAFT_472899 [Ophiobolus disseminans]|uniref:DUF6536 domain-containing protein n=1 Tax=Ophiobolus disseminans TaxID=1469910 RepID=A0A6A6ZC15_9PLEO|nr:hypothetical protein CC86DRAFT_472899 [Ophiobolus disseminans]